ncbi:MAG TPA: hypothetical protein PK357_02815 [Candidatus Pacearchaeota archaeon]|nr:hypothetical protein [Candidatus Pacearchaeota archaeon]
MDNSIELAKEIALETNKIVKRTYWTNEEIEKYFGKRSAQEIIQNGTTCFMNPCLDLTLVSAYLMTSRGIKHDLVIEEHLLTKDFNFNKLHFLIEYYINGKINTLNYKRNNEVHIFNGNYSGREDIQNAQMIKIPGENINPYKNLNDNLGYSNLEDLIKDKFIGFSLEKNISQLKYDNSLKNFNDYLKKYGEVLNIITKFENQPAL